MNTGALVSGLWDGTPTPRAGDGLRVYIHHLRRAIGHSRITRSSTGYRLLVHPGELDAAEFRQATADARRSALAGALESARDGFRGALAMWRGPAFADCLDAPAVRAEAGALDDARLDAHEACLGVELALGRHAEVCGELRELAAEHPLRETLHAKLILALFRCHRQADALTVYERTRRLLADELGLDPGAELRSLHERILRDDQTLYGEPAPVVAGHPFKGAPCQLPADVSGFAGRERELAELDALLDSEDPATATVISSISGMAGVGKTTLAVHWAHRIRRRFPDGQLYVNLRGFDPTGSTMDPVEAIRGFLDALEVHPQRVPAALDAQVALYRSLLSGKRILVVLDNARDSEQVADLLPGAPDCLVVVTSRNKLTGLIASKGAHALPLDTLSMSEAREFLARRLGPARVAAEPGAVHDIIGHCARLPLALSIVAAHATTNPRHTLGALAAELRETPDRLDVLASDDPATNVRAVFSWSYRTLSQPAARLFRLLGPHPGPDFSAPAAASRAALPLARTRHLLTELTVTNLLTEHTPGRYAFHDLLRAYATELAGAHDTDHDRYAATRRMLDHYLHTAHAAALLLDPHRPPIVLDSAQPGVAPECLTDHAQAMAWFVNDHAVLLAAAGTAVRTGLDGHAWRLAWAVNDFLTRQAKLHDRVTVQAIAVDAARRLNDPTKQAYAHGELARAQARLGRHDDAHANYRHALDLYTALGDLVGEAKTHRGLGFLLREQKRYPESLDHTRRAIDLFRSAGEDVELARALNAVGWHHALLGDHEQTLDHCQQALALQQKLGDVPGESGTWSSLGYAHHHLGHRDEAIACYREAIDLLHELGDRYFEGYCLMQLGDAHQTFGEDDRARDAWRQALAILDEINHPDAEQVRTRLSGG